MKQLVIPAIRGMKDFEYALTLPGKYIFLMDSQLSNLLNIVKAVKERNKKIMLHADLIDGLKSDDAAINFLVQQIKPHGIASTRPNVISVAKKHGILAVQILFLIDNHSLRTGIQKSLTSKPDYIELLPGTLPAQITRIKNETDIPLIVGGLIETKEQVETALAAGAVSTVTSNRNLWKAYLQKDNIR